MVFSFFNNFCCLLQADTTQLATKSGGMGLYWVGIVLFIIIAAGYMLYLRKKLLGK